MNHEFGNIGRRLPYDLPEHRLEALHERILRNTAARPAPAARTPGRGSSTRRPAPPPLPAPAGFTWRQG